jgi:hypothetical protein
MRGLRLIPSRRLRSKARAQLGLEQYEESIETFKAAFEVADSSSSEKQSIKVEYESAQREVRLCHFVTALSEASAAQTKQAKGLL